MRSRAGLISPGGGMAAWARAWNRRVAETGGIGCGKLPAEYCAAGVGSEKPQPQAGARRSAREAKRWMTDAAIVAENAMNNITSNPLYELRLSAIGTIESQGSLAWIGMRPPRISSVIGESASITGPGRIPARRQSADRMNMAESEYRSTSCAASAAGLRGRPRKLTPNALTKQAATKAAARASMAPTAGTMIFRAHCGNSRLCKTA